jgi:hypothetical protein
MVVLDGHGRSGRICLEVGVETEQVTRRRPERGMSPDGRQPGAGVAGDAPQRPRPLPEMLSERAVDDEATTQHLGSLPTRYACQWVWARAWTRRFSTEEQSRCAYVPYA